MRAAAALAAVLLAPLACSRPSSPVSQGVSWDLAQDRHARLSDVRYDVHFTIPRASDSAIAGHETIAFTLAGGRGPLVIDFVDAATNSHAVSLDGRHVDARASYDHLVIAGDSLRPGPHTVEIAFAAGNGSLNRNPDFLYTLFVPARAHSAFPCFDQPNLKARYTLTLDVPDDWVAVANGVSHGPDVKDGRATYRFGETKPIPTYLFAFAAGKFFVDSAVRDGRVLHMYHRETDAAKVAFNRKAIYDLVGSSLAWLERYTGIPYPFDKYDFVLIPAFQYGGMEHPGSILYNASGIMLDSSATQNQLLGRASVIAHETSHMWFGDLVTMNWFDDVWTKEVFANFMAAKIVNPAYPTINHELRFLTAHYPSAYATDRTAGTNPIRQPLDNLDDAGTLYGNIIYEKAPIVMRQLEALVGDSVFRDGLRDYLKRYSYGNATWDSLIHIVSTHSGQDLARWSHAWVDEPGRPEITVTPVEAGGKITSLTVSQRDPAGRGRVWPERLDLLLQYRNTARFIPVQLDGASVDVAAARGLPAPDFILPNGRGVAYGDFVLDSASQYALLTGLPSLHDDLARGAALLTLWDAMLDGRLPPRHLLITLTGALIHETVELNAQLELGDLTQIFWRYESDSTRLRTAPLIEGLLWQGVQTAKTPSLKAAYFNAYRSVGLSFGAVQRMRRIWSKQETVPGLPLSENDYTALAEALALRGVPDWAAVLDSQAARITNPDRKARFAFVRQALSPDSAARAAFFATLADPANRRHEPWVLSALGYLHHPLRAHTAIPFIQPSLEMLPEIQRTGDIFFPERWVSATLGGHNTPAAAKIVRDFLAAHPDFPPRLTAKVLQAADGLFRSARIVSGG